MLRDYLPHDSDSLLEMSRAGDDDAWGRLIAAHRTKLYNYVRRALPPAIAQRESPSDIVQQTLFEAFQSRDRFRGDQPSLMAPWLFGIVKNRMRDVIRRHGVAGRRNVAREVPLSLVGTSEIPANASSDSGLDQEGRAHVDAVLDGLSDDDRQLLRWRLEEDLSFARIGDRLSISEDAARMRHSRLMSDLRQRVKDRGENNEPHPQ